MGMNLETKLRDFHQAKWDEPIIFELSSKGERGILVPEAGREIEAEVGDGISNLPKNMIRKEAPFLKALSAFVAGKLGSGPEC